METRTDRRQKLIQQEKESDFLDFSTELLVSKLTMSITNRKLRDKLLKEKELDVPKVKKTQQNAQNGKNKKIAIPEALISN